MAIEDEDGNRTTCCDLNRENNVWVEGVYDPPKYTGICMLDSMTRDQVVYVLRHDPKAREDLPKVTSNPELLALLDTVPLLGKLNYDDVQTSKSARNGLPYYNQFGGQVPHVEANQKKS